MKKALFLFTILVISILTSACINNLAVQELNNKAKAYMEKGDYESAISRLKSSIDLDGSIFETHYNLAIAYTNDEDYEEAIPEFQKTLELKPDFYDVYYSLAVAQENYATDLLNGTSKKEKEDLNEAVDDIDTELEEKLSAEDKNKILDLYNQAWTSYQTYLDKASNIQDKSDVTNKMNVLKEKIENPDTLFKDK